jgi:hypothetical protein
MFAPRQSAAPAVDIPVPITPPLYTPTPRDVPAAESVTPAGRLRRCTFRRIDLVEVLPRGARAAAYEVMCLYGADGSGLPLGDVATAMPVCEACQATGIFRPDEA